MLSRSMPIPTSSPSAIEAAASDRQRMPAQFRPKPKFTASLSLHLNRERWAAVGHEPRRVSRIGLHRVGDDSALVEKRLQQEE